LYMIMLGFVYICLSLDLSSTYETNMCLLCFWSWLTSPCMMSSN
jgi:hypothetical protein